MRRLWNIRINAAARSNEITYSKLIHGLKLAGVDINRKMLSEMGIMDILLQMELLNYVRLWQKIYFLKIMILMIL